MSIRALLSMPWAFIYHSHNTMVNRKRQHLIQSSNLCLLNNGPCTISMDLNNLMSPEQPAYLKMYPQEARAICTDVVDFFTALNYNVQYKYDNNDKMTCHLFINKNDNNRKK
jgi:hypothetical protein